MTTTNTRPILLFAILATIGGFYYIALPECMARWSMCFASMEPAPYRYRVLQMFLENMVATNGEQHLMILADLVIHVVCVTFIYLGLEAWLRRWVNQAQLMVGIMLMIVVWMLAYWFYLRTVSTVLELTFVMGAIWFHRRFAVVVALVILASLNRETGFFVALIWMAFHADNWRTKPYWLRAGVLWAVFAAVTIVLRVSLGYADHTLGLTGTLQYNLGDLRDTVFINAMLAPIFFMAIAGYRKAPPLLQRLALVAGLYVVAIIVGAAWNESPRLILPIMPLILPVILYPMDSNLRGNRV